MLPSNRAASELLISGSKSPAIAACHPDGAATVGRMSVPPSFLPVAAPSGAALDPASVLTGTGFWPAVGGDAVRSSSSMQFLSKRLRTTGREPCRRSDAGFSRIPNWRRRCMFFYFSSSWKVSPFEVGSELFVCWPDSQD